MKFHPFEVTTPHIVYTALGGFIVLFGMFSLFLREKLYIGEACWAFVFGVIIGPYGAGIFDPRAWGGGSEQTTNTITLEFCRVVLAIGVFAIGVELPKAYMARHWKSLFFLLVPVMTWGWFVSAGLIYALIPGLDFLSSLAVAACLTPTDPILAAAVVGGKWADKHVPAHIRHLLAAESGCNDGAAFPFLFIALYLILDAPETDDAIRDWFLLLWLYQVIVGVLIGGTIGFSFRHLMKFCERRELIDRQSYVAQYVSLAMLTIGVTTLLGSDDLLAAFACGTAFAWDGFFNRQTEESVFSSVIDLLFNVAAFVFVGAWMPFNTFQDAELTLSVWRLIVIAILILLLRRLPIMIALYKWIPDVKSLREAVFSGHFGPIGIGAVFISTLATEVIHKAHRGGDHRIEMLASTIQPIVAFMVLCSITIHGLSIPGFSLGRRVHSVSRTWSRHAPPDWTNQAQLIRRGDDIVINRDSAMERGEATSTNGEKHENGAGDIEMAMREDETEQPSEGSTHTRIEETPQPPIDVPVEDVARPDTPPDGEERIREWQEPHHRIVETSAGAGEDVEVEVFDEEDPQGRPSLQHFKEVVQGFEHSAAKLERRLSDNIADVTRHARQLIHRASDLSEVRPDDEEEGWASDQSNPGLRGTLPTQHTSEAPSSPDGRKRVKPPKLKTATSKQGGIGPGRTRRRGSIRRTIVSHPPITQSHEPLVAEPDEIETAEDSRGRTPAVATTSTNIIDNDSPSFHEARRPTRAIPTQRPSRSGTGESSVRHRRLDDIKAYHSRPPTRETSPARSIRFADERSGNGKTTDSLSSSGPSPSGTPEESVPGDETDMARSRVTFEIPKIGNKA